VICGTARFVMLSLMFFSSYDYNSVVVYRLFYYPYYLRNFVTSNLTDVIPTFAVTAADVNSNRQLSSVLYIVLQYVPCVTVYFHCICFVRSGSSTFLYRD